ITIDHLIANRTYALGALLFFAVLCILGYAMAGACHMHAMGRDMFAVCTMFCNSGFMGIPLITSMFAGNSQVMACFTLYIAMDQILLWTVGLLLCTWHVKRRNKASFGNLINPMLIAIVIAMALLYFGISLPRPVLTTIQGLGDCSRYLALLYLGALLAYKPVLSMLLKPHVYLLIVFKMTILPLGVYFFADLFFSSAVALLMATLTSLPPMVATTMMARTYGGDETVAAESVFLATIACLVTIPVVQWLIAFIW
ncbi:MAG: AEC family transporter, partial [Peptococcaceae bacterium]|nr:AEC family transporter [Peptococcaceae bacterium]